MGKPENVLFKRPEGSTGPVICKITDFGLAKLKDTHDPNRSFMTTTCGTISYIAPEIVNGSRPYAFECDMWSLGVLAHLLLSGHFPFGHCQEADEALQAILTATLTFDEEEWREVSEDAKDLVSNLLRRDLRARLKPHEVAMHPWIRSNIGEEATAISHPKKLASMRGVSVHFKKRLEARENTMQVNSCYDRRHTMGHRMRKISQQ